MKKIRYYIDCELRVQHLQRRGDGGIGRRAGFRCLWWQHRVGSSPILRMELSGLTESSFYLQKRKLFFVLYIKIAWRKGMISGIYDKKRNAMFFLGTVTEFLQNLFDILRGYCNNEKESYQKGICFYQTEKC